jgi:Fe-S cluster assembly protein SufB
MTENTDKEINAQAERPRANDELISKATSGEYKYGFVSDIDTDIIPAGLTEEIVRLISQKKGEPEWLLDFRLKAFRYWQTIEVPQWAHLDVPDIDFQAISYYAAPKKKEGPASMDEVDPALLDTFNRLGIPLEEQKVLSGMAVDAVMDSVSVKTTHRERLAELGIIFCSFSEAVREYPDLVRKYLGKVVSYRDNFYAALNSAVFSDGSFVYIPKGVRCPMELSTYFRINASGTGQFERTLIVADDDAYVSYLEGCTAPMRDENQLHAAIVEIIVEDRAEVKYSTVQNWYAGDAQGRGGVYNFVTKRGLCRGDYSKLSWTQVETGSAITWKYPSCILAGEGAVGEFYSVAVTNNYQQADTGTKMVHTGSNTRSTIVSKGISAGHSENSYRGLVKVARDAKGVRNYTQCDSLLLSDTCGAHTFPVVDVANPTAVVEHEATTSKISEQQIFYCNQRGIPTEEAVALIVNGYAKEVMNKLPMEFAVEAQKLLAITLEGSVG